MKSYAKSNAVLYHATSFKSASQILRTGSLLCQPIVANELSRHVRSGLGVKGWWASLARSLSSSYIVRLAKDRSENNVILMVDTSRIKGSFTLAPFNYYYGSRIGSEYEERLISATERLDIRNAVVGVIFVADELDGKLIARAPKKFLKQIRCKMYYVKRSSPEVMYKVRPQLSVHDENLSVHDENFHQDHSSGGVVKWTADKAALAKMELSDLVSMGVQCRDIYYSGLKSLHYSYKEVYRFIQAEAIRTRTSPQKVVWKYLVAVMPEIVSRVYEIEDDFSESYQQDLRRLDVAKIRYKSRIFNTIAGLLDIIDTDVLGLRTPGKLVAQREFLWFAKDLYLRTDWAYKDSDFRTVLNFLDTADIDSELKSRLVAAVKEKQE